MSDQLSLNDVFYVYRVEPDDSGDNMHRFLAGKVMVRDGTLDVLADYHGHLGFKEGPMDDRTKSAWATLQRSPYFEVVPASAIHSGDRPDLLPKAEIPDLPEREDEGEMQPAGQQAKSGKFTYHHQLLAQPVGIEIRGGQVLFNGHPLSLPEQSRILANLRSGTAKVRYDRSPQEAAMVKMEITLANLSKVEPHLEDALGQLRAAVKSGHVDPSALKALTREIFGDHMVQGMGNKVSYRDFLSRNRPGVHIALDADNFRNINSVHGHETGDQAIRVLGQAVRHAADKAGKSNMKAWRTGGDEFRLHAATPEHAALFARHLRDALEALPPVGGTHKLSVSIGFGQSPEHADAASYKAKEAKDAAGKIPGGNESHAYSALPGSEGHIPLSPDRAHADFMPPPPEMRQVQAAANHAAASDTPTAAVHTRA